MRRVATKSGERWRCLKCLEETGWRPKHHHHHHHHEKTHKERLVDAILRERKPVRREKSTLGRSLLVSLVFHAMIVLLQFGSQGFGLPWLRSAPPERLTQATTLHAVLRLPPRAETTFAQIADRQPMQVLAPETPPPLPANQASARDGKTLARLHSGSGAPVFATARKTDVAPLSAKEKSKATASKKGAKMLATDTKSTWQTPLAKGDSEDREASERTERTERTSSPADRAPAPDIVDPDKADLAVEKATEQATVAQTEELAERTEKAKQIASAKTQQEAIERRQVEEQLRIEAEQKKAEQAAIAKTAQETQERKLAEERLRIETEHKLAEQAAAAKANQEALERKRAEEQLRIKAEEAALAKARQDALESKRLEDLARIEADRRQAEQAAAAKASQEALDRQRAADLERSRLAVANNAQNGAQSGAGKTDARGQNPATKGPQPGSTPPAQPPKEALGADPRRKASIVGPDPKNIQLAFYGEGWRQKVERIGAVNYPRLYKDRFYDSLVVTVSINSDGTLAGVRIDKSSGQLEMDDAVRRIVEMSAPFAAFPPDLKRNFDQIDITRTWVFEQRPRIR